MKRAVFKIFKSEWFHIYSPINKRQPCPSCVEMCFFVKLKIDGFYLPTNHFCKDVNFEFHEVFGCQKFSPTYRVKTPFNIIRGVRTFDENIKVRLIPIRTESDVFTEENGEFIIVCIHIC